MFSLVVRDWYCVPYGIPSRSLDELWAVNITFRGSENICWIPCVRTFWGFYVSIVSLDDRC